MCVLYYYEYLLLEKFKQGVILIEEPVCRTDFRVNSEIRVESESNEDKPGVQHLSMLIIVNNRQEESKTNKKLSFLQLQLGVTQFGYQWCKNNAPLLSKYNYFSSDESIIVYNKRDYKLKYKRISGDLWFLNIMLEKDPHRLLSFLNSEMVRLEKPHVAGETVFKRYVQQNNIVEVYLDNVTSQKEKAVVLPPELFKCKTIKVLSLKNNFISSLPVDIGRMSNLEQLVLTNNLLTVRSIPFTLTFCTNLKHVYLDNNLLDALPGLLLDMKQLVAVRRHGNHNYFKSTFIWYHTDLNERVMKVSNEKARKIQTIFHPERLEMLAVQSIIASKENFFLPGYLPEVLQDFISHAYMQFNICGFCKTAKPKCELGYKVFTFKNPYLGNTCVPFQHWACSWKCGEAIEIPARQAQRQAARKMDQEYQKYIAAVQREHRNMPPDKPLSCTIL